MRTSPRLKTRNPARRRWLLDRWRRRSRRWLDYQAELMRLPATWTPDESGNFSIRDTSREDAMRRRYYPHE